MRASWITVGIAVLALTLISGGPASGSVSPIPQTLPPSTAHGANFLLKSQADSAFCIEVAAGNTVGRTITVQQCGTVDNQRFMLTDGANGLNELVDTIGMCLDTAGLVRGDQVPIGLCDYTKSERLSYTGLGQLRFALGCLSITGAASGAPVTVEKCDSLKMTQRWSLGH